MDVATLVLFCAILAACVALDVPVAAALAAGLALFLAYGKLTRHSWRELGAMCLSGIRNVANILIAFALIGVLTALWRGCGTISTIVSVSAGAIVPEAFYLAAFLLNAMLSTLTGTSFGTSATMGVITMTVGATMGMDPVLSGGAILSGAYVGDRCSPLSTSAMLVAAITKTELFSNIRAMFKSAAIPFVLSCIAFAAFGLFGGTDMQPAAASLADNSQEQAIPVTELLASAFQTDLLVLLPAIAVVVLPLLRVGVKASMGASIALAALVAVVCQGAGLKDILSWAVFGYTSPDAAVNALLGGGGVLSMAGVSLIIFISSCYAGIFDGTGLLDGVKGAVGTISRTTTPFVGCTATAALTCAISCNQTLATMLCTQLCEDVVPEKDKLANYLEDTVIVIAALIPWSIASAVVLAAVGAPTSSILAACYLYLLPLCGIVKSFVTKAKARRS